MRVLSIIAATAAWGCAPGPVPSPPPATTLAVAPPATIAAAPTIVFLGTSLTAGLGLDPAQAYPARIEAKLRAEGLPHRVVNAGVSGETSAAARRRLDWLLRQRVDVLVIETGANDSLRGQAPEATRAEIQAMIDRARQAQPAPRVVLIGMQAPPNLGREYTERFRAVYTELARANDVAFVPFLLQGVAGVARLNQADGIHPTAEGQQILADTVWPFLRPLIVGGREVIP